VQTFANSIEIAAELLGVGGRCVRCAQSIDATAPSRNTKAPYVPDLLSACPGCRMSEIPGSQQKARDGCAGGDGAGMFLSPASALAFAAGGKPAYS